MHRGILSVGHSASIGRGGKVVLTQNQRDGIPGIVNKFVI